jgi:hypothetical protein
MLANPPARFNRHFLSVNRYYFAAGAPAVEPDVGSMVMQYDIVVRKISSDIVIRAILFHLPPPLGPCGARHEIPHVFSLYIKVTPYPLAVQAKMFVSSDEQAPQGFLGGCTGPGHGQ